MQPLITKRHKIIQYLLKTANTDIHDNYYNHALFSTGVHERSSRRHITAVQVQWLSTTSRQTIQHWSVRYELRTVKGLESWMLTQTFALGLHYFGNWLVSFLFYVEPVRSCSAILKGEQTATLSCLAAR